MNPKAESNDYTYDISIDDLRRYRTLSPAVILQWLQDAQEFVLKVVQPNLKKNAVVTFDQLVAKLQNQTKRLYEEFDVSSLTVFGSVARGEERPDSDVDFLVHFTGQPTFDKYMNLKFFLEDFLGCPVDLVTEDSVRPQTRPLIEGDSRRVA